MKNEVIKVGSIVPRPASDMVEEGLVDYGKTTIEQRAIPDYRDGCKPVQRRILYSMYQQKVLPGRGLKKSMAVVGDTLAKYHPHGDMAVFSTMVNLVQDRYPLIFGLGNWGDEYSPPAAPRYIDCRLTKLAMELFEYIDIAEFVENYSGECLEPIVLPSKIPLLLMNGAVGIAVGASVGIPPHNLRELIRGLILLVRKPNASITELLKYIKGPDYRLGGVLVSPEQDMHKVYETGKGTLLFRCQYKFEVDDKSNVLKVFNFAPHFNKDGFLAKCDVLVKNGLLEYAADDSADGQHIISVGFLSSNVIKERVLPLLYKTVSYQFHATERQIDEVSFRKTTLRDLMLDWLEYQREIKTQYYKHILTQLNRELAKHATRLIATKNIDLVLKALKAVDPLKTLVQDLKISKGQAAYVLDCKIGALAKISLKDQAKVVKQIQDKVLFYKDNVANLNREIIKDLKTLAPFCDERCTLIREELPSVNTTGNLWIVLGNNCIKKVVNRAKAKGFTKACLEVGGFYSVDGAGICLRWKPHETVKLYPNTFELVTGDYKYLAALDSQGNFAIMDLSHMQKREFSVLRTDSKLIQAIGCNDGDQLIVRSSKSIKILKVPDDIKISRSNTRGQKILKNSEGVQVEVYAPGDLILNTGLREISLSSLTSISTWYLIGAYNLVQEERGNAILNQDETLIRIRKNFRDARKIR